MEEKPADSCSRAKMEFTEKGENHFDGCTELEESNLSNQACASISSLREPMTGTNSSATMASVETDLKWIDDDVNAATSHLYGSDIPLPSSSTDNVQGSSDSVSKNYQKTEPIEITEIQHPVTRHRRNYKVTKKTCADSSKTLHERRTSADRSTDLTDLERRSSGGDHDDMTVLSNARNPEVSDPLDPQPFRRHFRKSFEHDTDVIGASSDDNPSSNRRQQLRELLRERQPQLYQQYYEQTARALEATYHARVHEYEDFNEYDDLPHTYNFHQRNEFALDFQEEVTDIEDDDNLSNFLEMNFLEDIEHLGENIDFMRIVRQRESMQRRSLPFPMASLLHKTECEVCFEETSVRKQLCCDFPVCEVCMGKYIEEKVQNASLTIKCIGPCDSLVSRDEILARLSVSMKEKYYGFLVDANHDPMTKTCPRCSTVYYMNKEEIQAAKRKVKRSRSLVTCPKCDLVWCFPCHAPEHQGLTCKEFHKGDKLLKSWAQIRTRGRELNAQKCPRCKVFIEREGGCDHMTCNQCGTGFCYRCGERYVLNNDIVRTVIGDHHSKFSPFGCKYNLLPNKPCTRKLVRGSVLVGKLLGGVLLGGLLLGAGIVLVGTSFIVFPAYRGYRYHKRRRYKKRFRKFQKINIPMHFLSPPDLPQLTMSNSLDASLSEDSLIFNDIEMGKLTDMDESLSSTAEHDPSQEVEVWVHCHHPPSPQEVESSDNSRCLDDQDVTMTTANLSKDSNDTDVLHVKTSYANTSGDGENVKAVCGSTKESTEIQDNADNQKVEESLNNAPTENLSGNSSAFKNESSENDSTEKPSKNKEKIEIEDGEIETNDENSVTQGCFVRIFGKKLPVVSWEKEKDGESVKTSEIKSKEGSLEKKKLHVPLEIKSKEGSLEKKKPRIPSEIKSKEGSLEKKKLHVPSVIILDHDSLERKKCLSHNATGQPDIVTCALQSKQANEQAGKGSCDGVSSLSDSFDEGEITLEFDPYYGLVSSDSFETTL